MGKMKRFDRRGSGPWFVVAVAAITFLLYSLAIAVDTINKCGDGPKEWSIFPPEWECTGRPGFG